MSYDFYQCHYAALVKSIMAAHKKEHNKLIVWNLCLLFDQSCLEMILHSNTVQGISAGEKSTNVPPNFFLSVAFSNINLKSCNLFQ